MPYLYIYILYICIYVYILAFFAAAVLASSSPISRSPWVGLALLLHVVHADLYCKIWKTNIMYNVTLIIMKCYDIQNTPVLHEFFRPVNFFVFGQRTKYFMDEKIHDRVWNFSSHELFRLLSMDEKFHRTKISCNMVHTFFRPVIFFVHIFSFALSV